MTSSRGPTGHHAGPRGRALGPPGRTGLAEPPKRSGSPRDRLDLPVGLQLPEVDPCPPGHRLISVHRETNASSNRLIWARIEPWSRCSAERPSAGTPPTPQGDHLDHSLGVSHAVVGTRRRVGRQGVGDEALSAPRRSTVNRRVPGVAWYRFRVTFGRRLRGYLSVVVLIGLIGGIAMASISAGRRTQSSYPTFLASTNPSDMTVSVYIPSGGGAATPLAARLAHLPDVKTGHGPCRAELHTARQERRTQTEHVE